MTRPKRPPLSREIFESALAAGRSQVDLVRELGVCPGTISQACRAFGIKLPHKKWAKPVGARELRMKALYKDGKTLEQIGQIYGVSRERVRQLLTKHFNLRADGGGQHVQAERSLARRLAKRDAASLAKWGCTYSEYAALRDMNKESERPCRRPVRAFCSQRNNARSRGIAWEMTLAQWWAIWQSSGKWSERGRGNGYVMCRYGDAGPYAVWNVSIAPGYENSFEASKKKTGLPMGVRKNKNYAGFTAQRMIGGKIQRLGSFPTPELAHAAYLAAAPQREAA